MLEKGSTNVNGKEDRMGLTRNRGKTWPQEQVNRYLRGLLDACEEVAKAPSYLGRSYEHVRSGYRKYPWGKHVIFYQILNNGNVLISRILHEKMDFDRHL